MIEVIAAATRRDVSRETLDRLEQFAALLQAENERQNLVAASTLDALWPRHIVDSAQLVRFEARPGSSWVDVGSGAGLPGLVVALLVEGPVTLVEPRRLRAEFLQRAVAALELANRVSVVQAKVENVDGRFETITGRAVAPLDRFLQLSRRLSTKNSVWVLPKGRGAESELAEARRRWHCQASIEPSRTDPDSRILVLTGVGAKGK